MRDKRHIRATMRELMVVPHEGDLVSWADGKLKIPYSTRYPIFIADESPWLLEPMRAMTDPKIRRVDVRAPAGSAKSLIGEIHIAYCVNEAPGLYYYVWQTDEDGKDTMEDRIYPMLEANEILSKRLPVDRNKKRTAKIVFPHMSLYCVGANESAAQSKRVKYLTCEEPHLWTPGMMKAFEDRVTGVKNYKILTLSTGSVLDDESDMAFRDGSCEVWQVACPNCGQYQTLTDDKDRLRAKIDSETKNENGEYDWKKIIPTVRYNCEHCGRDWPADRKFRHEQSKQGRYLVTNHNAPEDHRSFHLEAVSVHYEGFELATTLMKKMMAVQAYRRGAIEPFRNYWQKTRAMAWDESPAQTDDDAMIERLKGEYFLREPFEDEIRNADGSAAARFLCVDNQHGRASKGEMAHRWYVCRSFGTTECRLIDAGRIQTWEEIEELRIALGVEPRRVLVDVAFDTLATQAIIARYGWQGLWGDPSNKRSFPHHETVLLNGRPQQITRHYPFSRPNAGQTNIGRAGEHKQAVYYFWAQNPIKDLWHRMRAGMTEYRWTMAKDTPEEYRKQTAVEFKKQVNGKNGQKVWQYFVRRGQPNHLTDCDQECLVSGLMDLRIRQILWTAAPEGTPENEKQETTQES